jgi:hypothetical protein
VLLYYGIAIGWAWLVWAPLVIGSDGSKILPINPSLPVLTCIATLGPPLGSFITHRISLCVDIRVLPRPLAPLARGCLWIPMYTQAEVSPERLSSSVSQFWGAVQQVFITRLMVAFSR